MVEIIWTEPALSDLDAVADFIALENPAAAQKLVGKIFRHVDQLADHPQGGRQLRPDLQRADHRVHRRHGRP